MLAEAFHIARSGRPGPVLVDICKDVQQQSIEYTPVTHVNLRGYKAPSRAAGLRIPSCEAAQN